MERYMGLFRSEKVQDRGSDMVGLFAVRREAFAAAVCGGDGVGSDGVSSLGSAAFLRLVGRLCSLGYDGQGRRKDTAGKTNVAELCPMLWVDELAEGRGARSVGGFVGVEEVEGTKKSVGWVVEGYGVGPGDVFAGVWDGGGFELHALQVFDDSVGCGAVSVPDGPPAAGFFWEILVGGWLAEEVAVVVSRC
eukprot:scaffold17428_cov99-Amphora_coffeaeformis.AAC.1